MTSIRERYARIIDHEAFETDPLPPWDADERQWLAYRKADLIISEPGGVGESQAALKPFAEAYDFWNAAHGGVHDDTEIDDQGKITVGDCRHARTAIARAGLGEEK